VPAVVENENLDAEEHRRARARGLEQCSFRVPEGSEDDSD
jgi:hypothetical protein